MIDFILNHIPPWLYFTVIALACAAAFYFASPILIPIWRMLPTPVKVVLGGAVAIIGAILGGRYYGAKSERDAAARRDAEAANTRREVEHEVDNLSEKDARARLSRWNRD
jgi:tetrahydromethanopterin S-methyltransferase subunit E